MHRRGDLLDALGDAAEARSRARGWWLGAPAAAAVLGLAVWAVAGRETPGAAAQPETSSSVLTSGETVLACPVFESKGVEPPAHWLGAAAASLACRRAQWMLGGRESRVLVPAELLDFPRRPSDALPADPWALADVRSRSMAAANERAHALLDGSVEKKAVGFALTLRLVASSRPTGHEVSSEGKYLHEAVRLAMKKLEASGALPVARSVDDDVARWTFVRSPLLGAEMAELYSVVQTEWDARGACGALEKRGAELGNALFEVRAACRFDETGPPADKKAVKLDRSTAASLAATAPLYFEMNPDGDVETVARKLREARESETSTMGRGLLALAEGRLRHEAGDDERAEPLYVRAAELRPRTWLLYEELGSVSTEASLGKASSRLNTVWIPESPQAWWKASSGSVRDICKTWDPDCKPPAEKVMFIRRAHELAEEKPGYAMFLALRLLEQNRTEDARAVGAKLEAGPAFQQTAAAYVLGLVDAKVGLFSKGLARMRQALSAVDMLRSNRRGALSLMIQTTRLALVVGKEREVGDDIARRFVLGRTSELRVVPDYLDVPLIVSCMYASPKLAGECLTTIREARTIHGRWAGFDGADAAVAGAERFARGDRVGAAEAWRPIAHTGYYGIFLPADVFDDAGAIEMATRMDAPHLHKGGQYRGAQLAFVRQAKRAAKAGNVAEARELAGRIIDAWGQADTVVPAVGEMRELLKRLPKKN